MYAAIDTLVDKLDRQVIRHKDRRAKSPRRSVETPSGGSAAAVEGTAALQCVRADAAEPGGRGVLSAPFRPGGPGFAHTGALGGPQKRTIKSEVDLVSSHADRRCLNRLLWAAFSKRFRLPLMNLISRILPATNVLIDLPASSKKRAFEQAGLLFENISGIAHSKVFDSLFARERLGIDRTGPGCRDSARPYQGIEGNRCRLRPAREPIAV